MRVLVVDDEPLTRTALANLLSRRTDVEKFHMAEDAEQALAALRTSPCDVLLLDIHMPGMSGLQMVEQLSRQDPPVPAVVFITAYQEHAVEAFEKRAVDYVLKPFVPRRVHEALELPFSVPIRSEPRDCSTWRAHSSIYRNAPPPASRSRTGLASSSSMPAN